MARALAADGALLTTPVYLAMHMDRRASTKGHPVPPGFTALGEEPHEYRRDQCVVFFPNALKLDDPKARHKIAIIDDVLMNGHPLRLLKEHLREVCHYQLDHIRVGCCVTHKMMLVGPNPSRPDAYGFITDDERVSFPWGDAIFPRYEHL
jgi:hypothetical protein